MKKFLLILATLLFVTQFAKATPGCYWVFFRDKANTSFNPYEYFDAKAIERREKLGLSLYDITDYPLNGGYVDAVSALSEEVVGESRWFNAVGIMAESENIEKIKALPFVSRVVEIAGEMVVASYAGMVDEENDETYDIEMLKPELLPQLLRMQGEKFAENNIDGKGVRIAVFDGGFPKVDKHEIFSHLRDNNQIIKTWNFPNKKEYVYSWSSHGTMTLSCIAGVYQTSSKVQKLGLATGAEFLLARTEVNPEPFKEEIWWTQAMEWADQNGADIISSSLGYGKERYYTKDMDGTSHVAKAANMAARKGMLVFNSMGNEADDASWYVLITPADADSVISVGGIDDSLNKYRHIAFSSYGPTADGRRKPNVVAFGHAYVANPKGGMTMAYGTSFSCPLAAGFGACAWQTKRELTAMQLKDEIEKSGDIYPYFDYALGYGVPQASYFVEGGKKTVEPTFEFEKDGNTLKIKCQHFEENTEVFYNLMREDGRLHSYEHVNAEGDAVISISNIDMYSPFTVNVYYHGYVGSYKIEGNKDGNLVYARQPSTKVTDATKIMSRNENQSKREFGKPKKTHLLLQMNAGFAGVKTFEGTTNKQKSTFSALVGMQWNACKKYSLAFGVGMGLDDYRGEALDGNNNFFATPAIPGVKYMIKERFRASNLNIELFQRVKLASGGLLSNGLTWDLGIFGMWNFEDRYVQVWRENITNNYKKSKIINKNYDFINPFQWGVKTAITYDIVSVYAKLRISDLLNPSLYPGTYKDFMKLEIGMQLIFVK
ncbi:MAG: S8 family serine peptidase [Bacteroidales bacterium]|nr:S8 family serine peptidase [Bacteroidales bacterium]